MSQRLESVIAPMRPYGSPQNGGGARCEPVTKGPKHHFFGYYDKSPWDTTGRWLLGLQVDFMDRPPRAEDNVTIGLIDAENDFEWKPVATSSAWNWQQGCMLQWLGSPDCGNIIFNDKIEGAFRARIVNVHTQQERILERPIYGVDRLGVCAMSLNFSRLHNQRPGYGYAGVPDRWENVLEPADDGIYVIDIPSGKSRLVLSLAEAASFQRTQALDGRMHRFNHVQFSRDGGRVGFVHRFQKTGDLNHKTRLLTMDVDGRNLHCVSDHEMVSHYDWGDDRQILAWARRAGFGDAYFRFQDQSDVVERIGERISDTDGHCSFSPDGSMVLTDTYPDERQQRRLLVYSWATGIRRDLASIYSMPLADPIRCDLHPRWNRDGTKVCIDSTHEGTRQMYVLDVTQHL